ncbi:MAG TPA: hypothetical protein PKX92_10065 [Edaphocola sp.]|nr:hypothetical protein [Edaphocola sp.]
MKSNIFSEATDSSTNDVLDWMYFLAGGKQLERQNDFVIPEKLTITITDNQTNKVKNWYRRGKVIRHTKRQNTVQNPKMQTAWENIQKVFMVEQRFVEEAFINLKFPYNESINKPIDNNVNKIYVLKMAEQSGLRIPDSIISNNIPEIRLFLENEKEYIIKDVALDPVVFHFEDYIATTILLPTKLTGKEIIEKIKDYDINHNNGFLFVQKYISKVIELRIFYLKGAFYSMAIFSQQNEQTKVDFRNYDREKPNRCIPFQLPNEIERKLNNLMKEIKINCGSIDMIYTPEGNYVFLEVNPIGQFQWLSHSCNYDIEKQIAQFLIN